MLNGENNESHDCSCSLTSPRSPFKTSEDDDEGEKERRNLLPVSLMLH
jgi:hypothetical protein